MAAKRLSTAATGSRSAVGAAGAIFREYIVRVFHEWPAICKAAVASLRTVYIDNNSARILSQWEIKIAYFKFSDDNVQETHFI